MRVTGEKNRGTTHEKLWGHQDKQLTTPKHDEMVLWLLNKDNIIKLLPEIQIQLNRPPYHTAEQIINFCAENGFQIDSDAVGVLKGMRQFELHELIKWLHPSVLVIAREHLTSYIHDLKIESEYPIMSKQFIIGYIDIFITPTPITCTSKHYAIEVKPTISSFGETLRQLNTYRQYLHNTKIFLFTCDMGFKSAFESQGITVLEYGQ